MDVELISSRTVLADTKKRSMEARDIDGVRALAIDAAIIAGMTLLSTAVAFIILTHFEGR